LKLQGYWIIPALMTAFFAASQDAWVKRHFSALSAYEMMAFPMAYSLPLFCLAVPFINTPPLDRVFTVYFLLSLPVNGLGFLLHMRAIQISPLSLTLPYLAFTPVFIFLTGFLVLGELPNEWGIVGVIIIALGSYVLNIDPTVFSPLAPLRAFGREKGSVVMLLAALIYAFGAVAGKKAILHSSVMFFSVYFFMCLNLCFLAGVIIFKKIRVPRLLKMPARGVVAGGLLFSHVIFHGWAISMTKAVYMIAVKRISILFGIFYGGLVFHEKHLVYRLLGTGLMVAGAALVTLKG
jgi:drug/metabolite transporter (DMT)-like permease